MNHRVVLIAIVDFPNGVGGDTRRVHMLARSFVSAGIPTTLLIPCPRGLVQDEHSGRSEESIDGIEVIRLYRKGSYGHDPSLGTRGTIGLFLLRWAALFRSLPVLLRLKRNGLTAIHLYQPTFYDGAIYWLAARLLGVKIVADYCDLSFVDHDRIEQSLARRLWSLNYRWGMTWLPARLDRVFVISRYLVEAMGTRVAAHRLVRVPPVVDVAMFDIPAPTRDWRSSFGMPEGRVVLYAGSFFDNEGVPTLLDAAPDFLARHPDVTLVIVGGHPREAWEHCRELAAARRMADRIRFIGVRPSVDMPACFKAADVLVAPKADHLLNRAGVPTKLVEYLASGRPVVASRVGDIPEIVRDGVEALLVEPGDTLALAAAISSLLDDPARARAIGEAGRARVEQDFDVKPIGRLLRNELERASSSASERISPR